MGEIISFPDGKSESDEPEQMYWQCECGCISWLLCVDGSMQCTQCSNFAYIEDAGDGAWTTLPPPPDEPPPPTEAYSFAVDLHAPEELQNWVLGRDGSDHGKRLKAIIAVSDNTVRAWPQQGVDNDDDMASLIAGVETGLQTLDGRPDDKEPE